MRKKLIAGLLGILMPVVALAGCGSNSSGTETTASKPTSQTAAEESNASETAASEESTAQTDASSNDEDVELYMFISGPEFADLINQVIDEYKTVKPNVTINYETTQNDYPTMLKAKLNAGEVPDIFSSTAGKEIETYKEYSYDLTGQPVQEALLPAVQASMADASGQGCYGFHYNGAEYGIVYNQECLDKAGVTKLPKTLDELRDCCDKLKAVGIQPFACGYAEWWVFKQSLFPFMTQGVDDFPEFVDKMCAGQDSIGNYPMMSENMFEFVDIVMNNCEDKPLESDLATAEASIATGKAAMGLGMGPWAEGSLLQINPDMKISFGGYPVSDDASKCQIAQGADQALRVYKDSEHLQDTLDFVNFWFTSDYGKNWLKNDGTVPTTDVGGEYSSVMVQEAADEIEADGAGLVGTSYCSDAFWQSFGEDFQSYVAGTATKDETIQKIDSDWAEIDGAQ